MDPFTALSVASNVVSFVEFVGKIFSSTRTVYQAFNHDAGRCFDLESITDTLQTLNRGLVDSLEDSRSNQQSDQNDIAAKNRQILALCHDCNRVGDELLGALSGLKLQAKSSLWGSFRIALSSVLSADKVSDLQSRLDGFRSQISMWMLVAVR